MMQVGLRPGRCSWLRPRTQTLLTVVGLVVAVAYGLLGLRAANAQQPVREYQFEGLAIVDGEPAPKGTDVEIRVNGQPIAASQVNDEHGHWSLNVNAALLEKGVCDAIFFVGGRQADRQWNRCTVNIELEVKNPVVDPPDPPVDPPDPPVDPPDPPVDPPVNPPTDPPTDPDEKDDPPTDPDDEKDPPTDPPDEEDPPTGPPDEDDPPGDDDDDNDPPGDDPPGDDPPGDDPPGDDPPGDDPPGDDSPDGDPPDDDTPNDGPDSESPTEEPDDEDGAEGDDEESDGESSDGASGSSTVRPQSPPGTGTGGLLAGSGLTAWQAAIAVAAVTGALSGSTLAMARRRRRTG